MLLQPGSFPGISHPQGLQPPCSPCPAGRGKVQAQLSHLQHLQACKHNLVFPPPGMWRNPLGSQGGVNVPGMVPAATRRLESHVAELLKCGEVEEKRAFYEDEVACWVTKPGAGWSFRLINVPTLFAFAALCLSHAVTAAL